MPTFEQFQSFFNTFGWPGLFALFVWYWVLPRAQTWFDKHIALVDSLITASNAHKEEHEKTHAGMVSLGNATLEAASPERRPLVEPHVTMLKDRLRGTNQ